MEHVEQATAAPGENRDVTSVQCPMCNGSGESQFWTECVLCDSSGRVSVPVAREYLGNAAAYAERRYVAFLREHG